MIRLALILYYLSQISAVPSGYKLKKLCDYTAVSVLYSPATRYKNGTKLLVVSFFREQRLAGFLPLHSLPAVGTSELACYNLLRLWGTVIHHLKINVAQWSLEAKLPSRNKQLIASVEEIMNVTYS